MPTRVQYTYSLHADQVASQLISNSSEHSTENYEDNVLLPHIYLGKSSRIIDVVGKIST